MPFITPQQFNRLFTSPEVALDLFLKAPIKDLQAVLPQYEAIKGGNKRLYILPLIKNSSYQQLTYLSEKSFLLNSEPKEHSFLYRLNHAITLKTMIMEFDKENYRHLAVFMNYNSDVLREFSDIIINIKQPTVSMLIDAIQANFPLKLADFTNKIQTLVNAETNVSNIPIFNSLPNIRQHFTPHPVKISLEQSISTFFKQDEKEELNDLAESSIEINLVNH